MMSLLCKDRWIQAAVSVLDHNPIFLRMVCTPGVGNALAKACRYAFILQQALEQPVALVALWSQGPVRSNISELWYGL
jgi:hypothetical protein